MASTNVSDEDWNRTRDPSQLVDMSMRIVLTNTDTVRSKVVYSSKVGLDDSNMDKLGESYCFNSPDVNSESECLLPYFAINMDDPRRSEVGLQVSMSKDAWAGFVARAVGALQTAR